MKNPTFSSPTVKKWNRTIGSADAFVFLTPEYNHSLPAQLDRRHFDDPIGSWIVSADL